MVNDGTHQNVEMSLVVFINDHTDETSKLNDLEKSNNGISKSPLDSHVNVKQQQNSGHNSNICELQSEISENESGLSVSVSVCFFLWNSI